MPDQARASRRDDLPKKQRHNQSLIQQKQQGRVTKARSVMTSTPQHFRQRGFR
ncbi:hypothetical protein [Smaragdicoccus niigatensis]|uniref:hypothetical protein n=1 Tax=Smaragdicoccus niigatensis TaxID=359359 RepID=UPI0003755A59|nr:hypothetical protein [Smaragdicoccus niigatensis]